MPTLAVNENLPGAMGIRACLVEVGSFSAGSESVINEVTGPQDLPG